MKHLMSMPTAFITAFLIAALTACASPQSLSYDSIIMMMNPSMPDGAKNILTENIADMEITLGTLDSQTEPGITISEFYFDDCLLLLLFKMESVIATDRIEIICDGESLLPVFFYSREGENNEIYMLKGSLGDFREAEKIELRIRGRDHCVDISNYLLFNKVSGLKVDCTIDKSVTVGEYTFDLESYIESAGAGMLRCRIYNAGYYEKLRIRLVDEEGALIFDSYGDETCDEPYSHFIFWTKSIENPQKRFLQFIDADTSEVLEEILIE